MFGLGGSNNGIVLSRLKEIANGAEGFSIAVSYIQQSGWELLEPLITHATVQTRVLCTDQLGITDPAAIRKMMAAGLDVRAFNGSPVYHPKVYVAHYEKGDDRFVLGSANLSRSALMTGIEAVVTGEDKEKQLADWFNRMFLDGAQSEVFDGDRLAALEEAFAARLKSRLTYRKAVSAIKPTTKTSDDPSASAAIESAFAGLSGELSTLNVDQAGNNIRTFRLLQKRLTEQAVGGKALSDLRLLGFVSGNALNAIGLSAQADGSIDGIAIQWVEWWANASELELAQINPTGRLSRSRKAIHIFWSFPAEVTDYFLINSLKPKPADKKVLQTIELLANAGRELPSLTLDEVRTLSEILSSTEELPKLAQFAIADYIRNKGTRGWSVNDRATLLGAWRPYA